MLDKLTLHDGAIWSAVLLGVTLLASYAPVACAQSAELKLEPRAATEARLGFFPIRLPLSAARPAGIIKEPVYRATPKYATLHLGNGPKSTYFIALDEPTTGDYKIYFDKNRNGDLTDDGDGAWAKKNDNNGRVMYGVNNYTARASWGTPSRETASGEYGVAFYRFVDMDTLLMYREGGRTGTVTLDGKPHKVLLMENDGDAVYAKPLDDDQKPVGGGKAGNPVWMAIDLNDDSKFGRDEIMDIRSPFKLADKAFEAKVALDGSLLNIVPTTRKVPDRPKVVEAKPLLKSGTSAPDFVAEAWGGGSCRLSDYKGKVVILDFWATWCGPCQRSMPHVEKVYQSVKDKGVVALGVCVWDEKGAYEKWVPANKAKYTFNFAFDPAGRDSAKSIAGKLFNVSGIPPTNIIDKDGKVADAIVGYQDGDKRIEEALKKLGVAAAAESK